MKDPKLCIEKYCTRKRRKGKRICTTCDKRKWREKYKMKAAFQTLKYNTTRRCKEQGRVIPFTLTFEQFEKFCIKTKYMAGKGRSKESYTIDCIKEELGYTYENIQKLSKSDNSKKEQVRRKLLAFDYRYPELTKVV